MFRKSSYSDLEVQEILKTLFQEKKKVSELELKLKNQMPSPPPASFSSEDEERLKKELEMLRAQLREAQEQARGKESEDPQEPQESQFENIVQFLRKKAEDAALEIQALSKKLAQSHETQEKLQAELVHAHQIHEQFLEELKSEKLKKSEILLEDEALKAQMDQLRAICIQNQDAFRCTQEEKQHLSKKLQEQEDGRLQAQQELELLKQMMMKTLQEFTEARDQERNEKEREILLIKNQLEEEKSRLLEIQCRLEEQQKINSTLNAAISQQDAASQAHRELAQFTEELKQKLMQAEDQKQKVIDAQGEKDQLIASLQSKLEKLELELTGASDAAKHAESEKNEQESRLRVAQAHLAKKVREASSLAEKNEDFRLRIQELEHALENTKSKLYEAQVTLETQTKLEKTVHEKYQENLKGVELQAKKWEEKYFQNQEKMQELEARSREFKRLEERFAKLQQVLIHLNSILGPSFPVAAVDIGFVEMPQPIKPAEPVAIPRVTTIQPSLFDSSKPSGRTKETLFG
jgi:hypothetical protein